MTLDNYESPYLDSDKCRELLVKGSGGIIPLKLKEFEGALWLTEISTEKLVNVGNRNLLSLGIWSCRVRGDIYYQAEIAKSALIPGSTVSLVHESTNPYDKNAVAIKGAGGTIGYFNKAMARALSKYLASELPLEALVISTMPLKVIAADPLIMKAIGASHG